jgi:hypothetical protein
MQRIENWWNFLWSHLVSSIKNQFQVFEDLDVLDRCVPPEAFEGQRIASDSWLWVIITRFYHHIPLFPETPTLTMGWVCSVLLSDFPILFEDR